MLYELVECRILSEIISPNTKERAYQPGQDADNLSIAYVLEKLEHLGKDQTVFSEKDPKQNIRKIVDAFSETIKTTEAGKLLKNL